MRTIFNYPGSKKWMVDYVLSLIPEHKYYIEVFGGAANVLLRKPVSKVEVYNDINEGMANFFMVLAYPETFEKFKQIMERLPYSRKIYKDYIKDYDKQDDPILKAIMWYYIQLGSFRGKWGSYSFHSSWGVKVEGNYFAKIAQLEKVHKRLLKVIIENIDFRKLIKLYDNKDAFFYLDPPYLIENKPTRKDVYKYTMSRDDHKDLIDILLNIKGKAILHGFQNDIYTKLEESGWRNLEIDRPLRIGYNKDGKAKRVTEVIWLSPNIESQKIDLFNNLRQKQSHKQVVFSDSRRKNHNPSPSNSYS